MLAINDGPRGFVIDCATSARKRGARESHVVHPKAFEIIVVLEFDVMRLQHFAVRAQVNALVIDDDTVEVKEDCLNHSVKTCGSGWLIFQAHNRDYD